MWGERTKGLRNRYYKVSVNGNVGKGRLKRTIYDQFQFGSILKKGQVNSSRTRPACMKRIISISRPYKLETNGLLTLKGTIICSYVINN